MDSLFTTIRHHIYDLRYNHKEAIRLLRRDVKFLWQRITRGFDDSETWSLDYSLAKIILPRLKRFRELDPCFIPTDMTHDEWNAILDKIIYAFEYAASDTRWEIGFGNEESARVDEGLKLFAKYYFAMWW